jgi:nucleoside phosphorylase
MSTGSESVGVPLDRVVAVVADLPGGRCQIGTGFVVDGNHVLTAEHCTRDKVTGRAATRLRVVRASDGIAVDVAEVIGDLVMDVAVVTLRGSPWPVDLPAVVFARVRRDETGVLTDCHGIGYPLFQRDPDQRSRGTAEFHGTLYQTDERETGHLLIREPLITPGPLPNDHDPADPARGDTAARSPWGGLSGTLVFHRGRAIGVVVEHHPRQGSNALRILGVDRLVADQTLAAALHLPAVQKLAIAAANPLTPITHVGVEDEPVSRVDVLIVAALPEEFAAARAAGLSTAADEPGVAQWEERGVGGSTPFIWGEYRTRSGQRLSVALARPTRMGGRSTGPIATTLTDRLGPSCLAMCGVCAGNPADTAPGDVVVADTAYAWDEGKQSASAFEGDHRQFPLDPRWVRSVQDFDPAGLPSHGAASDEEAMLWFLEQLHLKREPRDHPARVRYFPSGTWQAQLERFEADGLITRDPSGGVMLTNNGAALVRRRLYDDVEGPQKLPFAVRVAPMASGSAVVTDAGIWQRLRDMGMRKIAAVEMEAATIATIAYERRVPHWLVVKGVMDSADHRKDDRYKRFAARASAEVLFALLERQLLLTPTSGSDDPGHVGGQSPAEAVGPQRQAGRSAPAGHSPGFNLRRGRQDQIGGSAHTDSWTDTVNTPPRFVGRDQQLAALDRWDSDPAVSLVGISAWGGAGKTTLVAQWLASRQTTRWQASLRGVFAWSFIADADVEEWAHSVLSWAADELGFTAPGGTLATGLLALLQSTPVLLVLDGLEMLQDGPQKEEYGHLLNGLLRQTLTGACRSTMPSLILLTSRFPFADLAAFDGTTARMMDLPPLTPEEGAAVLRWRRDRTIGVRPVRASGAA